MSHCGVSFSTMVKQPRSLDNKQIVLDQSVELLITRQDNNFRIADVCEVSGLSSSVIYSYFRSREGLIDSTYAEIFKKVSCWPANEASGKSSAVALDLTATCKFGLP